MPTKIKINKSVKKIELTGNASPSEVLKDYTFYKDNPEVKQVGTLALSGNATPSQVVNGYSFYSNNAKNKQVGTLIPEKKKKIVKKYLGTIQLRGEWMTSTDVRTFDVKPGYPTNWRNLTNDNFCDVAGIKANSMYQNEMVMGISNIVNSYNASTGVLTVTFYWGGGLGGGKNCDYPIRIITMEDA